MTYCPYQKNYNPTMMIASPSKFQRVPLTNYSDHVPSSYKNLLMYPSWHWPPTPEGLPGVTPSFRLPPIHRYNSMHSIPSPLTPGSLGTHTSMCPVEPRSPMVTTPCPPSFSPNDSPSASTGTNETPLSSTPTGSKRGRPRADVISSLQYFGSNSSCTIRCHICHRVFPREKSLQAHLRTHTGERPYRCDYPNCNKSFVQSGQLKTHQRLHSGEKPFKCSGEGCNVRFTHANRHCSDHPQAKLLRDDQGALEGLLAGTSRHDTAIAEWLDKYVRTRLDRTSSVQPRMPPLKKESPNHRGSSDDELVKLDSPQDISLMKIPLAIENRGSSVKRQLLSDENSNQESRKSLDSGEPVARIPLSPKRISQNGQVLKVDPRHPMKKRILAYNQMLMKENQGKASTSQRSILPPVDLSPKRKTNNENPSETQTLRDKDVAGISPKKYSFLRDLQSSTSIPEASAGRSSQSPKPSGLFPPKDAGSDRWNGALALMQLASSPPSRKFSSSST